jgi:ribosomal protein L11
MGKEKGSGKPNTAKIGSITKAQVKQIAEKKMPDLMLQITRSRNENHRRLSPIDGS